MPPQHPSGYRWKIFKQLVVRTHGDTCMVCSHGGARQAGHVIPVTERPDLTWDLANIRPVHGAPGNRCWQCDPVKGMNCNGIMGMGTIARAQRIIAEKTAARPGTAPAAPPEPEFPEGREW